MTRMSAEVSLTFDAGTLALTGPEAMLAGLPGCRPDPRTQSYRAEARWYRAIIEALRREKIAYRDSARRFEPTPWTLHQPREAFPHQKDALAAWWNQGGRSVVVLPTGTGKTYLALLAIAHVGRPSLVITPTIDLLNQWLAEMERQFQTPIGCLGGGSYDLQPLTVSTYDSAFLHLERWGDRYGLVVFDECHHLPGPSYQFAAIGSLAPYRLGLTATPERADGREALLEELIGPVSFRREIKQLSGDYLAGYRVERREVELAADEAERYQEARTLYRNFLTANGLSLSSPTGWRRFLQEACRSAEGRAAFDAYREQKRLALAASAKLEVLDELLQRHARDRVLIFTYDNATVYRIARRFLVPAITHQTKTRERQEILKRFHDGTYPVVVTSQVLNEGVDVPAANVGIVLSGTGSVREHVQRLGRLLRKHGDKEALLYEVVTRGTAEEFTSERRRQHHAYR